MAKSNAKKSQLENENETTNQENAVEIVGGEQAEAGNAVESAEAEGQQESQPESAKEAATPAIPLHTQLEKAVRSMSHSGNPDAAHALNKVELLMGSLKYSLPAAISAVSDDQLKVDLQSLLALL